MRLWRFCLAALLYDWVAFIILIVIPIRAESLHATSTELGVVMTVYSVFYTVCCLLAGRLADRASKGFLVFFGCAGAVAACFAIARVETLGLLIVTVPILAVAGSLFWPSVQGAVGMETEPERMEKTLSIFNVMWSAGKTLGFVFGGWLTGRLGEVRTLWWAAAAVLPIFLFYPWRAGAPKVGREIPSTDGHAAFRAMGYVANFVAFGIGAAFQNQYFKYLTHTGIGASFKNRTDFFGTFLGAIFLAQTVGFIFLQKGVGWTYRRGPLYGCQVAMAGITLAISFARSDGLILALAPLLGLAFSFAYASSIYYSLHGSREHGKYSGVHEAVLGAGNFLVPLVGGALADRFGDLRFPYWLAAATALGAVALQETLYRRRSRSSSNRSMR